MNLYEELLEECDNYNVEVYIRNMKNKGLYSDNVIWLNKNLTTTAEKVSILAEEIGHYQTSVGDILNQSKLINRKQEYRARVWAHERVIPLSKIIEADQLNLKNKYELADFIGVTESFLDESLIRYRNKYGLSAKIDNYTIYFDPLEVVKWAN